MPKPAGNRRKTGHHGFQTDLTGPALSGMTNTEAPKGTEITDDQSYLDMVASELNNRPRRILGYRTPAEVFTDLLASSIASTS